MRHTPKPWIKDRNIIFDNFGSEIARVDYSMHGCVQGNALLITSAPILLEACQGTLAILLQNKLYPADIKAAKVFLNNAIDLALTGEGKDGS